MRDLLVSLKSADRKTKSFIFTCVIYSVIILLAIVYCYGRLDFVRSGEPKEKQVERS